MDSKEIGLIEILHHLFQTYLQRVQDIAHLASLEARLAGRTLITILVLFFLCAVLIGSSWLCINVLIFVALMTIPLSKLLAAVLLVVFNLLALICVWLVIVNIKKNLTFPATRRQLQEISHGKTDQRNRKHRKSHKAR